MWFQGHGIPAVLPQTDVGEAADLAATDERDSAGKLAMKIARRSSGLFDIGTVKSRPSRLPDWNPNNPLFNGGKLADDWKGEFISQLSISGSWGIVAVPIPGISYGARYIMVKQ